MFYLVLLSTRNVLRVINKMKIGSYEIKNVEFSVLKEDTASNLLGLNALLQPTNSINIDINSGELSF